MNEQRLCRDCKHVGWFIYHTCRAPQNKRPPDPVTGKRPVDYMFCDTHRSYRAGDNDFDCGWEGRFFERRVSLFERIKLVFSGSKT